MSSIRIQDRRLAGATMLPDDFVDYYMPRANGEFVKIFLYLLRSAHAPDRNPSLSSLADFFSCTEKDILRALRYWEKAGLLDLRFSDGKNASSRELEEITLLPVSRNLAATRQEPEEYFADASPDAQAHADAGQNASAPLSGGSVQISSSRLRELKDNEEARKILYVAERYLGRPLSTTDMRRLLYFFDELKFPFDLLDYLIEYSVTKGGHNLNYIEKVGLAWHAEGIRTLRDAKAGTNPHTKEYYTIFRAFGIRNRDPIPDEKTAMNRWLTDYGFSQELIAEAASRTVKKTGQPSFPYAERILSDWHRAGVRTLADVEREDARHQETRQNETRQRSSSGGSQKAASRPQTNRFSNFTQRSDYDFDRLEQNKLQQQAGLSGRDKQSPK